MGQGAARSRLHRDERAAALKHAPRRRFGQHFLTDAAVVAAIVDAIDPRPGDALVEIGPGLGALTWPLAERAGRLVAIELDRDLAARLKRDPRLSLIEADVLTVDLAPLAARLGARLRLVGNLPYNISTPVLFRLLGQVEHVADQHLMLQKEVVRRMAAAPGNKDYGRLSVMLQWRYRIESVLDVPPQAFEPEPRVESALARMLPLAAPPRIDLEAYAALVAVAFSQRRKLLSNTLGPWLDARGYGGDFDLRRRAEEVPVAEYAALARQR